MSARRVLIAAESLGGAESALSIVRVILDRAPAILSGLIVEPEETDRWSGRAPTLVSTRGTVLAAPAPERMRRIARRDAAEFGALISLLAGAPGGDGRCRLSRGELVRQACAGISGEDILVLGQRPVFRRGARILLLGGARQASETAHDLAEALGRAMRGGVTVIDGPAGAGLEDLLSRIDRTHAGAVVLDLGAGPVVDESGLRRIYVAARCPVVAFGVARIANR